MRVRWLPVVTVVLGALAGCAGLRLESGTYVVRDKAYRVGAPGGWTPIESGADVALGRAELGAGLMAHATCDGKVPTRPVPVLARHLRFGLRTVTDLIETPVTLDGLPGTATRFRATLDGVPVAVRAVTVVDGGCVYDLVAVAAPEQLDATDAAFGEFTGGFARLGRER